MADFTIIEGDCLDVLSAVPDGSVNLIVTSPPYGNQRKATYGGVDPDRYSEWFLPRAAEFRRVLRDDGSFVLNIKEHCQDGERHTYVLRLILALKDAGWRWIDELVWHKKNAYPVNYKTRLRDGWERLWHLALTDLPTIYKEAVMVPVSPVTKKRAQQAVANSEKRVTTATGSGFNTNRAAWLDKELIYPSNVLWVSSNTHNQGHPAPFPREIPEFFIKLFTVPGDTVLDPFAGSGTTMFQAYEMDRHAIGCEIMPEYCDLIRKRKAQMTMRLPGLETT